MGVGEGGMDVSVQDVATSAKIFSKQHIEIFCIQKTGSDILCNLSPVVTIFR